MTATVALRTALIWHDEVMSDVVVEKPRKITLGKSGSISCQAGSTCDFSCTSGGSVCPKATCEEGSTCTFDCTGGNCNAPVCADDACTGN